MRQRPDNTVNVDTIQIKLGDVAALYGLYKGLEFDVVPHIRDQMFSPNELKMLQYVDGHPKLQQLLGEYKAQQDELKQMDAAQPRMWKDGSISTSQWHDLQQARQNIQDGLDNATAGILGAAGQVLGQYFFPDDPGRANFVGLLGRKVGEIALNIGDAYGGLKREMSEYIPNATKQDLYTNGERPYSERLSTDPNRFTPPWEKGIPGAPYDDDENRGVGHETEVVGEHTNAPRELSEANPPDMGAPKEDQQDGGSQYYDANPPIDIPSEVNQSYVPPEINQSYTPSEAGQSYADPELNQSYTPSEAVQSSATAETDQSYTPTEVTQSAPPIEEGGYDGGVGSQGNI